jgi:hypothetical protein
MDTFEAYLHMYYIFDIQVHGNRPQNKPNNNANCTVTKIEHMHDN